ncbi:hypothetical protein Mpsy_3122 [Methanolobus psychrophilus R15]|nr:hypothetical protein Mpsy_3122 [Methanolobus psychrophilus R15]
MYYKDVTKFDSVKSWFAEVRPSANSKRNHMVALNQYVEFTGINPDELIAEAELEEESISKYKSRKIKKHLTDFRNFLEGNDEYGEPDPSLKAYAPNTVRLYLHSVHSFYNSHEITTKSIKNDKKAIPLEENTKRIEDNTLVADVLKKSSLKQKAIILSIVSSGLASIDIRNLPLKKYIEGYNPETEVCTLKLRRHKSGVDFVTFFNPEATRAINDYLDDRRKSKDPAQHIYNNEGYLFIVDIIENSNIYLDPEYDSKRMECHKLLKSKKPIPDHLKHYQKPREDHRQYSVQGFVKMFRDLSMRCGIHTEGAHNVFRAHNLRKLFKQILENNNVNHNLIEMWMGHEIGAVNDAYSSYSPIQLETYITVMHYLYIDKNFEITGTLQAEIKKLKKENETHLINQVNIDKLQKKNDEIMRELDEIKKKEALKKEGLEVLSPEILEYIQQEIAKVAHK